MWFGESCNSRGDCDEAQKSAVVDLAEVGPPHRVARLHPRPDPLGVGRPVETSPTQRAAVDQLEALVHQRDRALGVVAVECLDDRRGQTDDRRLLGREVLDVQVVQALQRKAEVLGVERLARDESTVRAQLVH